jgi:HlyD family secretion protein
VRIDALPGEVFSGSVESLSMEGLVRDGATSYGVRVSLVPDPRMRAGMSLTVSILVARRENVLLVPVEAVYGSSRDAAVRVLVDGKPVARSVVAGLSSNTLIEILEGLAEGDRVVTGTLDPNLNPFERHSRSGPAGTGSRG